MKYIKQEFKGEDRKNKIVLQAGVMQVGVTQDSIGGEESPLGNLLLEALLAPIGPVLAHGIEELLGLVDQGISSELTREKLQVVGDHIKKAVADPDLQDSISGIIKEEIKKKKDNKESSFSKNPKR